MDVFGGNRINKATAEILRRTGRMHRMGAWLLIMLAAVTVVVMWRLGIVVGRNLQERARVASHCTQMEKAAASGAVLWERQPDGTTLLVMPGSASLDQASVAEVMTMVREMTPL